MRVPTLLLLLLALSAGVGYAQRVIVSYEQGARNEVLNALTKRGFEIDIDYPDSNLLAVRKQGRSIYTPDALPTQAADVVAVAGIPKILKAEPDSLNKRDSCPVTDSSNTPGATGADFVPYGIKTSQVQATSSDILTKSASQDLVKTRVMYCIADDGLDTRHPDIATSTNILNGTNYVGTRNYPWNKPVGTHGTHVTGTIAAGGDGKGILGVVRGGAYIFMTNVFGSTSGAYTSDIIDGLKQCDAVFRKWKASDSATSADKKMVISMSLGSTSDWGSTYSSVLANLYDKKDILIFASSGNSGTTTTQYPSSYPSVISVAAVDSNNNVASFSTRHSTVELAAPGVGVVSTVKVDYTGTKVTLPAEYYLTVNANTPATWEEYPFSTLFGSSNTATVTSKALVDCGEATNTTCPNAAGKVCLIKSSSTITYCDQMLRCKNGGGLAAIIYNRAGTCDALPNANLKYNSRLCSKPASNIPTIGVVGEKGAALQQAIVNAAAINETVLVTVRGTAPLTNQSTYASWDGTSMACPHASGIAGLVWSQCPKCENSEIRRALQESALDKGTTGRDTAYGYGVVQAVAAYNKLTTYTCCAPPTPPNSRKQQRKLLL